MKRLYSLKQFAEMRERVDKVADECSVRETDVYYAAMVIATSGLVKVKLKRDLGDR